jgi:hypothetical protein
MVQLMLRATACPRTGSMHSKIVAVLIMLVLGVPVVASAHHSFAYFDSTQVVKIKGTVKEFQWTNPHSWLQLVVVNDSGVVEEWSLEGLSPNVLGRMGWKRNSVVPGDVVTVYFNPTRNGTHGGSMVKVVRPDGTVIGGPPPAGTAP